MCADGAQRGRDDKRRLKRACFCSCCGCGCFPPSAQPSFPSRLALQYPEEKAECFVPPILRLRRLEAKREIKSERPHGSQGISDEESFQAPAVSEATVDIRDIEWNKSR